MNIEHKLHLCWRPVSDNIRNTIKMELPYRDLMFGVWKSHIKSLNFSSYFLYKFLNNFYNFINISALQFILHNTILLYHFRRAFYNCTWCAVNHITHTPSALAQYAHMYAWKYCIYYVAIPFLWCIYCACSSCCCCSCCCSCHLSLAERTFAGTFQPDCWLT